VETVGPFTVFVSGAPWPYYARPTLRSGGEITPGWVSEVIVRQRALRQPVAFEWVRETAPGLGDAAAAVGLKVNFVPLLALTGAPHLSEVAGVAVRSLGADDPGLEEALAAVEAGFRAPGTAVGLAGIPERDRLRDTVAARAEFTRGLIRDGHVVFAAAETDDGVIAAGSASPRGRVAELTGIATLPAWRRRGVGAAVTAALAGTVRALGVETVMLSAADDAVARVYERVGFERIGAVGEAGMPS
jgi:ribosomal protein S18 acetylase RimI-like enzyme